MEDWKIVSVAPRYKVSSMGNIYSLINNTPKLAFPDAKGYMRVQLYRVGKKAITCKVHRLVAQHFIPNPKNLPQINHKNGIKSDNTTENLEWTTNYNNTRHALDNGLFFHNKVVSKNKEILAYAIHCGYSIGALANHLNTTTTTINRHTKNIDIKIVQLPDWVTKMPKSKYYYWDKDRKRYIVDAKKFDVRRKQFKTEKEAQDFVRKLVNKSNKGFAANPELASIAGRKGGQKSSNKEFWRKYRAAKKANTSNSV